MKFKIDNPCKENWLNMNKNEIGRHCEKCDKSVVDFTAMSRAEIMNYLLENPNQRTCGRLQKNQFEFTEDDIPVLLTTISKPRFRKNAFLILALVCASLSSCTNEKSKDSPNQEIPIVKTNNNKTDSLSKCADTTIESNTNKNHIPKEIFIEPIPDPDPFPYVLGEIEPPDPPVEIVSQSKDTILDFAEVMPEFKGGMNAFMEYLQANLKYPDLCKEMGIEGKVYVRFVVHSDGSCSAFQVLKTPHHELGKEAIRVLQKMPAWNPGIQNGQKVTVRMTVPVSFKLD
jgi:TonB family protein